MRVIRTCATADVRVWASVEILARATARSTSLQHVSPLELELTSSTGRVTYDQRTLTLVHLVTRATAAVGHVIQSP